jgi:hypothetical protein
MNSVGEILLSVLRAPLLRFAIYSTSSLQIAGEIEKRARMKNNKNKNVVSFE